MIGYFNTLSSTICIDNNFTILRLERNRINVSLFKNKSFVFTEDFNFGFDLIIKDISKLCSLKIGEVENLIKEVEFKNTIVNENDPYLMIWGPWVSAGHYWDYAIYGIISFIIIFLFYKIKIRKH